LIQLYWAPERTKAERKIQPDVTGKEMPPMSKESLRKQADRAETIADQTVDDQLRETLTEAAKEYRKDAESSSKPDNVRPGRKSSGEMPLKE
jgi:hypothetical protein